MARRRRRSAPLREPSDSGEVKPAPGAIVDQIVESTPIKQRTTHLLGVAGVAIGIGALGAAGMVSGRGDFVPKIREVFAGEVDWSFVLYVVTLLSMVALAILWYANGMGELELLDTWLKPSRFKFNTKKSEFTIIIGVGIIIPIMATFSYLIALFCVFFTVYLVVDIWSWKVRRSVIGLAIHDSIVALAASRSKLAPPRRSLSADARTAIARLDLFHDAAGCIRDYYLGRPHYTRLVIEIALMATAAIMSVLLHVSDAAAARGAGSFAFVSSWANAFGRSPPTAREHLRDIFFVCFLAMFWGSEVLLHLWRKAMYIALEKLDTRKSELKRE